MSRVMRSTDIRGALRSRQRGFLLNPFRFGGDVSYAAAVLSDAPRAYYRMGEASGATLVDSSGNNLDGTYTGVTLGVEGLVVGDTAAQLNNSITSYASVASNALFNSTHISVEALVKATTWNAYSTIACRDDGRSGSNRQWQFRFNSGKPEVIVFNNAGTAATVTASSALATGTRYHVVFTFNNTTVRIYVNGAEVVSSAQSLLLNSAANVVLLIGNLFTGDAVGGGTHYAVGNFNGVMDELAIYPTALTAARVLVHAQAAGVV